MITANPFSLNRQILFFAEKNTSQKELSDRLEVENFEVEHVSKLKDAFENLKHSKASVVLIDASNNEMACLELCYVIKSNRSSRKRVVIITSDKPDEQSEVAAFRAGADDFVLKPLRPVALVERLKARLEEPKDVITINPDLHGHGSVHIDRESYVAFVDYKPLHLSRKEFELLYLLASHPGKIFTRAEVFEKVWKKKLESDNRTVDVHILRLRKKLGKDYIQTQKGIGYRFAI